MSMSKVSTAGIGKGSNINTASTTTSTSIHNRTRGVNSSSNIGKGIVENNE